VSEAHWRVVVDDRARKDLRRIDPPDSSTDPERVERLAGDRAGVSQRARESAELGHDERVAAAARTNARCRPGALAVGAGQTVVDVDALGGHAECLQAVAR
jgi:hypothetical protein